MTNPAAEKDKSKRAQLVREHLMEVIRARNLRPGDPLPSERVLMAELNVGRPAVREAMQSLETIGILSIRHGGRARIADASFDQIAGRFAESMHHLLANSSANLEHLKQARVEFEKFCVAQAAKRRTDADLDRLRRVLDEQARAQNDNARFMVLDAEFHRTIAAIGGNPIFTALSEAMLSWLADFHIDLVNLPGCEQLILSEHAGVLAAIEARDPVKAARAMSDHILRANVNFQQLPTDGARRP